MPYQKKKVEQLLHNPKKVKNTSCPTSCEHEGRCFGGSGSFFFSPRWGVTPHDNEDWCLLSRRHNQSRYTKKLTCQNSHGARRELANPVLEKGRLPDDLVKRIENKRRAIKFFILKNMLYRHSLYGVLLWCFADHEIHRAKSVVHFGVYGAHQSKPKHYMQFKRLGYY